VRCRRLTLLLLAQHPMPLRKQLHPLHLLPVTLVTQLVTLITLLVTLLRVGLSAVHCPGAPAGWMQVPQRGGRPHQCRSLRACLPSPTRAVAAGGLGAVACWRSCLTAWRH